MRRLLGPGIALLVVAALVIGYVVTRAKGSKTDSRTTPPATVSSNSPSPSSPSSGPASGYAARVLQDHPLAFWPLDDKAGPVARDLTGHYDGTYVGSPARTAPLSNGLPGGRSFDGSNQRVTANALTKVASWPAYTMEVWVRLTQESNEEHIVAFNTSDGGNGPALLHDQPSRRFKFRDCEGPKCAQVFSRAVPRLGVPYHLVVTVDANDQGAFYVNGALQERFTSSHRPPVDGLFTIGGEYDNGPTPESFFKGDIADVAIYSHALDAATVQAHYQAGR